VSLATRCPACGTVFRVVQDQLKVSEGWVRCGRCSEVFNAVDGLFDLESELGAPPPAVTAAAGERSTPPDAQASAVADTAGETTPVYSPDPPAAPAEPEEPEEPAEAAGPSPPQHAAAAMQVSAGLAPPSRPAALVSTEEFDARSPLTEPEAAYRDELPPLEGADAGDRVDTPGFIRRADRQARWRHPAMRGSLAALALLLSITLAGQLALHFRDSLAADWPPARPWLQQACDRLGCRIEAPRRIDSLSVDASGLSRVATGALYQLTLVLHNRAATAVRMPAIELALTDSRGQTTVRRVLYASELGQHGAALPPHAELPLRATLDLGDRPVAGYTVELFYP